MIEVLNKKKKRIGIIKGKRFFNKKHKLLGSLDNGTVKDEKNRVLIRIDKHNNIFFGDEPVGFILDSKIYFREEPIFEFLKEKGELHTSDGKHILFLDGDIENLGEKDFFGTASIYLDSIWWEKVTKMK